MEKLIKENFYMVWVKFYYHQARTIKAPFDQKIRILYNFFTDDTKKGIKYAQFLKMVKYI